MHGIIQENTAELNLRTYHNSQHACRHSLTPPGCEAPSLSAGLWSWMMLTVPSGALQGTWPHPSPSLSMTPVIRVLWALTYRARLLQ
jgi:hypothetical protein